ncbi:MAG: SpaA isopeptide-forming pilin-related protein [Peptoniphilaceae bacterium]|nr:SpaA isopeptide-forming pilin-related protein [Peptoniphilaceae bacterium]MDY6085354.1 SpaA isopeptide-forming pilin-related protein [Peptoniphilaceae bacterium]
MTPTRPSSPTLRIVNVDEKGHRIGETVTFELKDKVLSSLKQTVKTDENGVIKVGYLTEGDYEPSEIQTPEGYIALDKPIQLNVANKYISVNGTPSFDGTVYVVNEKKDTPNETEELESPVDRIDGNDRAEVAVNLVKRFFGDADKVILVQSGAYADAMSALNVSQGRYPILYTKQLGLYGVTVQALQELKPNEIILVGGQKTIDPVVEEAVKTLTKK